jgi:hypothetical protein
VTFSDPKVAEVVNSNFVSAWFNRSPQFSKANSRTEEEIFKWTAETFPTKNICTFAMAPDGRVFHYVAGYLSPELFLRFMDSVLTLRRAAFDEKMGLKAEGPATLRRLHAKWAGELAAEARSEPNLSAFSDREYRGSRHAHHEFCRRNVQETLRYWVRVHQWWSKATNLPDLGVVRFRYLYGNEFSQEGPASSSIERDPAVVILVAS